MKTYNDFIANYIIRIPELQRDYVQGSGKDPKKAKKRDRFIKSLLKAIKEGSQIDLDFIYGSSYTSTIKKRKEGESPKNGNSDESEDILKTYFVPIDGQQRLTTLALLGWLLSRMSGYDKKEDFKGVREMVYSVRTSTESFVMNLLKSPMPDLDKETPLISTWLKTVPDWFAKSWETDPSIEAMLDLLDVLHEKLTEDSASISEMARNFFEKPLINFEDLDMEEYNLTEDLYVKMNARGKHLTDFENWKAEFYGFLKQRYGTRIANTFSKKVEEEWCNFFWKYAIVSWKKLSTEEQEDEYPRIDEYFMRVYYWVTKGIFLSQNDVEKLAKKLKVNNAEVFSKVIIEDPFGVYEDPENVRALFAFFDIILEISEKEGSIDKWLNKLLCNYQNAKDFNPKDTRVNIYEEPVIFDKIVFKGDDDKEVNLPFSLLTLGLLYHTFMRKAKKEKNYILSEDTTEFARIFWDWELNRNWSDGTNLRYAFNIRVENFKAAKFFIDLLLEENDIFNALLKTDFNKEIRKISYRDKDSDNYIVVKALSNHPYLKGCLDNIYPSLDALNGIDVLKRFTDFTRLTSEEKIRQLTEKGFKGCNPRDNRYRFYGYSGHWDYVFTNDNKNFCDALNAVLSENKEDIQTDTFDQYMLKYFIGKGYFYFYLNNTFEVKGFEEPNKVPLATYYSDPYSYCAIEVYKKDHTDNPWGIEAGWGRYREGYGSIDVKGIGLKMRCLKDGWKIWIDNFENWGKYPNKESIEKYISIDQNEIANLPDELDRVRQAVWFLNLL